MAFNQDLSDRFIRHAIDLEKFKASERRRALRILKQLEQKLVIELAKADLPGYQLTSYQAARTQALLEQTRATIGSAYKDLRNEQQSDWQKFTKIESEFARQSINRLAGVELASVALSADELKSIVSDLQIEGGPAAEWWSRQAQSTAQKFADTVRLGVLEGDTNSEISRAVRTDVMETAARNADSLVRTAINVIQAQARLATFAANDDVIKAVMQHSTLDARTTTICMAYSGATYTNDGEHTPLGGSLPYNGGLPRHWSCRSYWIPVVRSFAELAGGLKTGGRRAQNVDEYFASRLRAQGFTDDQIAGVVARAQASMDGQVPEHFNYEAWLKTKPVEFQQKQLGPTKYKLWKRGRIGLSDLVDQSGDPRTVDELEKLAGAA